MIILQPLLFFCFSTEADHFEREERGGASRMLATRFLYLPHKILMELALLEVFTLRC